MIGRPFSIHDLDTSHDTREPNALPKRCMPMSLKVLGAGFGRTGTHSLKTALEMLGLTPCHHMYEVRKSPEQVKYWSAAVDGEPIDWDAVFEGFQAQVDWPASFFWKELSDHFPEAKVILTTRDPDAWYASISRTILPASAIGRTEDPDPAGRAGSELIYRLALQKIFDGRLDDKAYSLEVFRKHQEEVIAHFPPDRLLVLDVKQGWNPLCEFLGLSCPEVAFPSGNSTAEFLARKTYLGKTAPSGSV